MSANDLPRPAIPALSDAKTASSLLSSVLGVVLLALPAPDFSNWPVLYLALATWTAIATASGIYTALRYGRGHLLIAAWILAAGLLSDARHLAVSEYWGPALIFLGLSILLWAALFSARQGLYQDFRILFEGHRRPLPGRAPTTIEAGSETAYTVAECGLPMQTTASAGNRYQLVHRLQQIRNYPELQATIKGDAGELFLLETIGNHVNYRGFVSFAGKRIPVLKFNNSGEPIWQRAEIDLIVLMLHAVFVYEVKNWYGRDRLLVPHPGLKDKWARQDMHTGKLLQQEFPEDLVKYNQTKVRALQAYLAGFGVKIEESRFINRVVFLGTLQISPAIARLEEVIVREEIFRYLENDRSPAGLAARLHRIFMDIARNDQAYRLMMENYQSFDQATLNRVTWILDHAGTWDRITVKGGRRVTGDLLSIRASLDTPEKDAWLLIANSEERFRKTARIQMGNTFAHLPSRELSIDLSWRHGVLSSWTAFIGHLPLGRLRINGQESPPLTGYEVVKFQSVGRGLLEIPLINIVSIELG